MAGPLTVNDELDQQERSSLVEVDANHEIRAVTFTANGEYFVGGGTEGVRVWRVEDGTQMATIQEQYVRCVAASKDGKWIAAGTYKEVIVWDAKTYERVFAHYHAYVNGVDFSPDSTRLVMGSLNSTASIWDILACQCVLGPLGHKDVVIAAKYSPNGARIATATPNSIRVWDANDGRLLVDVPLKVPPWYNTGLLWSNQHLFVASDSRIKQLNAFTGSEISDWPVPDSNDSSCIVLPQHGEFIAYATNRTVTVWSTSTHAQLGSIQHTQDIRSIALSPDDCFLAVGGEGGKITVNSLAPVNNAIPLPRLHPTFQEPDIQIDSNALDLWMHGELEDAETLLTTHISTSGDTNHDVLASRALVRTRLQHWDDALEDAEKVFAALLRTLILALIYMESIKIRPSVIGYIAKSIALIGRSEKHNGYRACDIAFERFHSTHVSFLLLIKAIIIFTSGDHIDAISRIDDLIATVRFNSICHLVQAHMYFLLGNSHVERGDYEHAIEYFECARVRIRSHIGPPLFVVSLIFGWKFDDLGVTVQKHLCQALYLAGRTKETGELLLKMLSTCGEGVELVTTWASDFVQRFLSDPKSSGDAALTIPGHDNIMRAALLATSPIPLLEEWAKLKLTNGSWKDALAAAVTFVPAKFTVYRAICERLEKLDQILDATECFHEMMHTLGGEKNLCTEQVAWIRNFKLRFSKKLEHRGDAAVDAQRHDEAIAEYTAALSLNPASPQNLFIKRSKTYIVKRSWKDALNDANEVIKLDSSSSCGYERKHAALHMAEDYDKAIDAFETMLSKMAHSPDPGVRKLCRDYVDPAKTKEEIRKAVQETIRDLPRVLINTSSGRLLDKPKQASSFESLPVFKEMISSMTTSIDYGCIEKEVKQYYHYATFSHRWEDNEPLFDQVVHVAVYDLEESPTHDKLRMFCKIVQDAGFNWAWSDTCCINKSDHFVLQEALVAMFKWYEGSALTIVFLRDVHSPSRPGDLARSIWNTRAWTFQEYHASKVIRFYTENWKLYMNLDISNHKDSPAIISEMEEVTGVSAQTLMALRPGLDDIREKLCLASRRETTLTEDAAYSLLGVFSASLPIVYGEGDKALGRLLAQLLTSSGDASTLAWTGRPGSFNSCLPSNISVFSQLPTTHIPSTISDAEMDMVTARLNASSLNITMVQRLYDRLSELPVPLFAGKRMKLPCIMFKLGPLSAARSKSGRVYRAQTAALGVVEIRTKEDLSRLDSLYLVHPWIDFLLHRHPVGGVPPEGGVDDQSSSIFEESSSPGPSYVPQTIRRTRTAQLVARLSLPFSGRSSTSPRDATSLLPPLSISQIDKRARALQFVARLRQPFGALLFTPTRQNVAEYRRVASESRISVQVQEDAPWNALIDNARMLDVL